MVSILKKIFIFPTAKEYVSDKALDNLKFHKYSAVDKSLIANHVMKHYWNFATSLFPLWMAPNLITLIGFAAMGINACIALAYMKDFTMDGNDVPLWIFFSFAFGVWFYSTCDNVDGKQARRTGSSSPLGELMDHGIDSLNCALGSIIQGAGLAVGFSNYILLLYSIATINFFFSTWESFHTGTLYLSYINGPTEGIIFSTTQLILSGIFGPKIFHTKFYSVLPDKYQHYFNWIIPGNTTFIDIIIYSSFALMVITVIPGSIYKVYIHTKKRGANGTALILSQLLPIIIFYLGAYLWVESPISSILNSKRLIVFILATGLTFGEITTSIILSHMTKQKFPNIWKLIIPICIGAFTFGVPTLILYKTLAFIFGIESAVVVNVLKSIRYIETIYLWLYLFYAIVTYSHYSFHVVTLFCKKLKIRAFSLKPYSEEELRSLNE